MEFEWKLAGTVFATVFLAELGDKTQFATMLFATDPAASRLTIVLSASFALICSVVVAVFAGALLSEYVNPAVLKTIAGIGFIAVGIWVLWAG